MFVNNCTRKPIQQQKCKKVLFFSIEGFAEKLTDMLGLGSDEESEEEPMDMSFGISEERRKSLILGDSHSPFLKVFRGLQLKSGK